MTTNAESRAWCPTGYTVCHAKTYTLRRGRGGPLRDTKFKKRPRWLRLTDIYHLSVSCWGL